jgi:hypothetical protein
MGEGVEGYDIPKHFGRDRARLERILISLLDDKSRRYEHDRKGSTYKSKD